MPSFLLPLLATAAASLSPADTAAIDRIVTEIYAPYRRQNDDGAPWERTVYSRETSDLIARWQEVMPEDEVDDLNDGDWFCECQDWDNRKFRIRIASHKPGESGGIEVEVDVDLGFGEPRDVFLLFLNEGGTWVLDDLYSEADPDGIKQALRDTIKADEALRQGGP